MRTTRWLSVLAIVTLPLAAGCQNRDDGGREASSQTNSPGNFPTGSHGSAVANVSEVKTGHQISSDYQVPRDKKGKDFAPGQPVFVSMKVDGTPVGSTVRLDWLNPNGQKIDTQTKTVEPGDKYIAFQSGDTQGWLMSQSQDYTVVVWLGGNKADTVHFNIVPPDKADKVG